MGALSLLRAQLAQVKAKIDKRGKGAKAAGETPLTAEEEVVRDILQCRQALRVHVHKIDDIACLLRLQEEYGISVTVEHACDVNDGRIYAALKERGIPVVFGPLDAFAYKVELRHENWRNVRHLLESGVDFGLMTDHPVIPQRNLLLELRWFIRCGLNRKDAIEIITRRNAQILGIDGFLGTLGKGKWASFSCWNGDPFDITRYPVKVVAEGEVVFEEGGEKAEDRMSRFTVVIADDRYAATTRRRRSSRKWTRRCACSPPRPRPRRAAAFADADAILVNLFPMTADIIEALPKCRVISRYGVGYDNVAVEAATRKGIWVTFVPDYCFEEVADHALALLLGCIRKIGYKDRMIRQGKWNLHRDQPCYRMEGKTLGILGYGNAAHTLLRKVSGLGFGRVLMCDPYVRASTDQGRGRRARGPAVLLAESDYISVHVPLTPETRHMIGRGGARPGEARGDPGEHRPGPGPGRACAWPRRCGADGWPARGWTCSRRSPCPAASPLRQLDNVIFTDHAGWYSEESVVELKTKAARNVAAVLAGGAPAVPGERREWPAAR